MKPTIVYQGQPVDAEGNQVPFELRVILDKENGRAPYLVIERCSKDAMGDSAWVCHDGAWSDAAISEAILRLADVGSEAVELCRRALKVMEFNDDEGQFTQDLRHLLRKVEGKS